MAQHPAEIDIEERTALHALGALGQHEARALETMLLVDTQGAAELKFFEGVVALIGLAAPDASPPPEIRSRLLGHVENLQATPPAEVTEESESLKNDEFLTVRSTEGEWKEFSDGVMIKQLYVNQARATMTFLLRVSAGASVPAHRHPSMEEIFVVEGNCRVNSEILAPGDYRCALPGSIDRVITSELGATVLVVGPIDCELL